MLKAEAKVEAKHLKPRSRRGQNLETEAKFIEAEWNNVSVEYLT